jgi:hypothetical protein
MDVKDSNGGPETDAGPDGGGETDAGPDGGRETDAGPDGGRETDAGPDGDSDVDRSPDAGSGDGTSDADAVGEDPAEESVEPTPQSAALRRQQLYVGYGGALLAGAALGVGTFQQFTDSPVLAALAALAGTGLVVWLVRKSIFPGGSAVE